MGPCLLNKGDQTELRVEAQENLLRYINTFLRDGVLYIESEQETELKPTEPIQFVLVTPFLQSISVVGSGDVEIDAWEESTMALSVAGSGDMFIRNLAAERVDVTIAGSGDIDLSGSTVVQEISIAGSGDYNAPKLYVTYC